MLYTVKELAARFNTSEVTIYKKFKLPNIKTFVVKEDGKFKLKEEGLTLLEEIFNVKDEVNSINPEDEVAATVASLSENLIDSLSSQINFLQEQILEKDKHIERSDELMKNMQVLIKNEQENLAREQKQLEHFKDVDRQLINAVRHKEVKPETTKQSIFKRIFKR